MKRIFKYPLDVVDFQVVNMPKDAELLDVQVQNNGLQLWALVEPSAEKVDRVIAIVGTGNPYPEQAEPDRVQGYKGDKPLTTIGTSKKNHIATVQTHGGALVWHVFDLAEVRKD